MDVEWVTLITLAALLHCTAAALPLPLLLLLLLFWVSFELLDLLAQVPAKPF